MVKFLGTMYVEELQEHGEDINIENCSNEGIVHSTGNYSNGGIIGYHRYGTINIINSANRAVIGKESEGSSGGIIGTYSGVNFNHNNILNIYNCYNLGDIIGKNYCGGILGLQGLTSKTMTLNIENCYSVGKVQGKYPGGIVGKLTGSDSRTTVVSSIKDTYWLTSSTDKAISVGNCTNEEIISNYDMSYMKSESFCNILNNNIRENKNWNTWILKNNGYPEFQ